MIFRKLVAIMLSIAMLLGITATAFADASAKSTGAWEINTGALGLDANKEAKAAWEKALEGLDGVDYEPIALLATQAVQGANYCVLAKATTVSPDPATSYELVYIYEDLEGNASVENFVTVGDFATDANADGAWETNSSDVSLEDNKDVKAAWDKAFDGFVGSDNEPIAYIASQVVSGTNYCIFSRNTSVTLDPVTSFQLVYIYESLEGDAELGDMVDVNIGADTSSASKSKAKAGAAAKSSASKSKAKAGAAAKSSASKSKAKAGAATKSSASKPKAKAGNTGKGSASDKKKSEATLPNPYNTVESLKQAADITGFGLDVPTAPEGYPDMVIRVLDKSMIEVIYTKNANEAEENSAEAYRVRKGLGADDISGDYSDYANKTARTIGDYNVTLKGNGDAWSVATWNYDGYAYAVEAQDKPMALNDIAAIVSAIK